MSLELNNISGIYRMHVNNSSLYYVPGYSDTRVYQDTGVYQNTGVYHVTGYRIHVNNSSLKHSRILRNRLIPGYRIQVNNSSLIHSRILRYRGNQDTGIYQDTGIQDTCKQFIVKTF